MMFWSVVMMYSSQKVTYIVVILHLAKRQLRFCKIKKKAYFISNLNLETNLKAYTNQKTCV